MVIPLVDKWSEALGILSLPPNIPAALTEFTSLIDDICYYAGDESINVKKKKKKSLLVFCKIRQILVLKDMLFVF